MQISEIEQQTFHCLIFVSYRAVMPGRQSVVTSASSYSRRNRQEEALVRRRNSEWDRQQLWNGVTQYFHTWDVQSSKHNDWASPHYYNQRSLSVIVCLTFVMRIE